MTKTLARKYKTTVASIYRKYTTRRDVDGYAYKVLAVEARCVERDRYVYWCGIPLKVVLVGQGWINDRIVRDDLPRPVRSDLIRRLQVNQCELCGSIEKCEVYHVRKLVDIKRQWRNKYKPKWVEKMIELRRRMLVVCAECHEVIHTIHP